MHKQVKLFAVFFILFTTQRSFSQFTFGISPGLGIKSAYFGYKTNGRFLPYLSIQALNANISYNSNNGDSDKLSGSLIVPTIGTKFYLQENQKLKPYFDLAISKPINTIKENDENVLNENIKLFAGSIGFGTEYFLDPQFSVGGEFGLMYMHGKYKDSYYDDFYEKDTQETYKVSVNPTYAKISFNFYFKK